MTKTFALIGAAGYIAPRHMQAINDVGGRLLAALDPHDSVGILDRFSPECLYFKESERFDRWLSKNPVDYVVVCSPNYLHDSHSLMAMRNGCDVICEKPLVCNERNLDNLAEWEAKTGKKVNAILQCRLHADAININKITSLRSKKCHISVEYNTPRGKWYDYSWKADIQKSGGLPTNIGVHFFDLCCWCYGDGQVFKSVTKMHSSNGAVHFRNKDVVLSWDISIDSGKKHRYFVFDFENGDREAINLTSGFEDLHTKSYREILAGRGFGIEDARPAIRIVEEIRNAS